MTRLDCQAVVYRIAHEGLGSRCPGWACPDNRANAPTPPGGGGNVILDAFNALLAMEQGEPRPSRPHGAARSTTAVTDELVDEVARRVIERLAPNTARELVRQVVSDVAERLIREEITRIKSAADTKR